MSPMSFQEFEPPPALREHVACYWGAEIGAVEAGHMHQVIPDGCVGLIATRRADGSTHLTLQGPRLDALWIPVHRGRPLLGRPILAGRRRAAPRAAGARAPRRARTGRRHPGAARREPRGAAGRLRHGSGGQCRVGRAAGTDGRRLSAARRRRAHGGPRHRGRQGEAPLADLAAAVGLSPRQLQRRFSAAVGLSPKQFARVRRLRGALSHVVEGSPVSWAAVAADLGFADQAHLIREFGALAGLTPVAVAERVRPDRARPACVPDVAFLQATTRPLGVP